MFCLVRRGGGKVGVPSWWGRVGVPRGEGRMGGSREAGDGEGEGGTARLFGCNWRIDKDMT